MPDFMFQIFDQELATSAPEEKIGRRSSERQQNFFTLPQFVTSSWGARRYLPYAFSERGVAMLSSILHSPRAIAVNIEIMRAFVRLRQILANDVELSHKLDALEKRYDAQFKVVFDAIRELMTPKQPRSKPIGFVTPKDE